MTSIKPIKAALAACALAASSFALTGAAQASNGPSCVPLGPFIQECTLVIQDPFDPSNTLVIVWIEETDPNNQP